MTQAETAFQARILSSLSEIDEDIWDGLANPGWFLDAAGVLSRSPDPARGEGTQTGTGMPGSAGMAGGTGKENHMGLAESLAAFDPFLAHRFLRALEESGAVSARTGWLPCHIVLEEARAPHRACAALPCYLKSHSQGEYVFDHGWAHAFENAGGAYYPKLQAAVPFTPVGGRRLLAGPPEGRGEGREGKAARQRALLGVLAGLCQKMNASSAHITFLGEDEWRLAGECSFLRRRDLQFHWCNEGYDSFEDFTGRLTARKRKQIRKERAVIDGENITVEWLTGADIKPRHWDSFFDFYQDTGQRKWGRPYLNRAFFEMIGAQMAPRLLLVMARRQGRYIAGALNFIGSHTLYGRYWGAIESHRHLHFEICYYQAIEFALAHRLAVVEAGAQGPHKLARGYRPQSTFSAHFIAHGGLRSAVAGFLDEERRMISAELDNVDALGPYKHRQTKAG